MAELPCNSSWLAKHGRTIIEVECPSFHLNMLPITLHARKTAGYHNKLFKRRITEVTAQDGMSIDDTKATAYSNSEAVNSMCKIRQMYDMNPNFYHYSIPLYPQKDYCSFPTDKCKCIRERLSMHYRDATLDALAQLPGTCHWYALQSNMMHNLEDKQPVWWEGLNPMCA